MSRTREDVSFGEVFDAFFKLNFVKLFKNNIQGEYKHTEEEINDIESKLKRKYNLNIEIFDLARKLAELSSLVIFKKQIFSKTSPNIYFVKRVFEKEDFEISYNNADLIFKFDATFEEKDFSYTEKALFIVELTTFSFIKIKELFLRLNDYLNDKDEIELSFSRKLTSLEVEISDAEFFSTVEKLINIANSLNGYYFGVSEFFKTIQASLYALDYFYKHYEDMKNMDYVYISTIYPMEEPFINRFLLNKKIEKGKIKELFNQLTKIRKSMTKIPREVKDIIRENIEVEFKKNKNAKARLIPKYTIDVIRKEVEEIVRNTMFKDDFIILCHPAGAGKTSSIMKIFEEKRSQGDEILFLYFTTRVKVREEKAKELKNRHKGDVFIFEPKQASTDENRKFQKSQGKFHREFYYKKGGNYILDDEIKYYGQIKELKDKIEIFGDDYQSFVATLSLQAITRYRINGTRITKSTLDKLIEIIKLWIEYKERGKVLIAIDEIVADETNIFKLYDILQAFTLKLKDLKDKISVYILDANFSSGYTIEKSLKIVEKAKVMGIGYIPPAFYRFSGKSLSQEEYNFTFADVKIKSFTKNGYIGNELNIEFDLILDIKTKNKKEDILKEKLFREIKSRKEKGIQVLVYIQNKELISHLGSKLREENISYIIRTSVKDIMVKNFREYNIPSDKGIKEFSKEVDVVLVTSAVSRGVDIPYKEAIVCVTPFEIESNLAEIIQVISRLRGEKDDYKKPRNIKFILYDVIEEKTVIDYAHILEVDRKELMEKMQIDKKQEMLSLKKIILETIEAYINPNEKRTYFIPFPAMRNAIYERNFLEGINEIMDFAEIYNIDIPIELTNYTNNASEGKYYYPFILSKSRGITIKIKRPYNLLKLAHKLIEDNGIPKTRKLSVLKNIGQLFNVNIEIQDINNSKQLSQRLMKAVKHIGKECEYHISANVPIANFLPLKEFIYKDSKKHQARVIKIVSRYFTKHNLQILGNVYFATGGKLIFNYFGDLAGYPFYPRIPIVLI